MISKHARTARIAPDVLNLVKQAAELQGRSVSDFVVSAAQEAAQRAVKDGPDHPPFRRRPTPLCRTPAESATTRTGFGTRQRSPCRAV